MKEKVGFRAGLGVALVTACVLAFGSQAVANDVPAINGDRGSAIGHGDRGDVRPLPIAPLSDAERAALPSLDFTSTVRPVLESSPNDYAFFYLDAGQQPVIGFTGKATPEVMNAIKSTGQQAKIIEDVGFTDAEYTARAEKLVVELQASWPKDVLFPMMGVRPDLGIGAIGVTPIAEAGSADPTGLIQQIKVESPFSIEIDTNVLGPGTAAEFGRQAGEWLVGPAGPPYNGAGYCTAGFVSKSTSSSDLGVLTAGHCPVPDPTRYYNVRNGETITLTSSGGAAFGSAGDARFLRSPLMFDAWFMVTPTTGRDVTSKSDPALGTLVCFFGRTSNEAKCGSVLYTSTPTTLSGTAVGKQTVLTTSTGQTAMQGDSGGPAYLSHEAMGVISGFGSGWSSITRTSVAEGITGTKICLSPSTTC